MKKRKYIQCVKEIEKLSLVCRKPNKKKIFSSACMSLVKAHMLFPNASKNILSKDVCIVQF